MRQLTALAATLVVVVAPAYAAFTPIGDPLHSDSWEQRFNESGLGAVDLLGVRMVTQGDTFKDPAYRAFSLSGWELELNGSQIASASGDSIENLEWNLHFAGEMDNALTFDYVAFSEGKIVNAARAVWAPGLADGTSWIITPFPGGTGAFWLPNPHDLIDVPPAIPVPGAAMLGVIGLISLRWMKRAA